MRGQSLPFAARAPVKGFGRQLIPAVVARRRRLDGPREASVRDSRQGAASTASSTSRALRPQRMERDAANMPVQLPVLTAQTKVFSSPAVAVFSEAVAVFSTLVAIAAPFLVLNVSPIHGVAQAAQL